MLPGFLAPARGLGPQSTMREVLYGLGLEASLKLCLDAGDPTSYPPALGQLWKDTSGGGFDFNLGTTSGVEAADPTFTGVAGNQSKNEFFSFNGSQTLTLGQANPAWVTALHAAGALISFAAWMQIPSLTTFTPIFGTMNASVGIGCEFNVNSSGLPIITIANGTTNNGVNLTLKPTINTWTLICVSANLAASGTVNVSINGSTETTVTSSYTPVTNASAASQTAALGNRGAAFVPNATKVASLCAWQGKALANADFQAIFAATRDRFGV